MKTHHTISLASFINGSRDERQAIADHLAIVYAEHRFFCITDHGISETLAGNTEALAQEYFSMPLDTKLNQIALSGCGYFPSPHIIGMPVSKVSPNELFLAHREASLNPWPTAPGSFRDVISSYSLAAEQLSLVLLRVLALALNHPEFYFVEQAGKTESFIKLFNFLPLPPKSEKESKYRLAAHHDYSAVSIIRCPNIPSGLQVLNSNNEWVEAHPEEGGFVILIGEQMTRWSDGDFPASWHRVRNPQPDYPNEGRRMSICYFFNPECMAGDVEGYLSGRAEYANACAAHLSGCTSDHSDWETPARNL